MGGMLETGDPIRSAILSTATSTFPPAGGAITRVRPSSATNVPEKILPSSVTMTSVSNPLTILALGSISDSSRYSRFARLPISVRSGPTNPPPRLPTV